MRTAFLAATLLLSAFATAGCVGADDDGMTPSPTPDPTMEPTMEPTIEPTPTPGTPSPSPTPTTPSPALDSTTYRLENEGVPGQAKPGSRFNFTLFVNGSLTRESDHVGAHYADNDTVNPPGAGRRDCEHTSGTLPGSYNVACTIQQEGTWHVWGHARINDSGELRNWWTSAPDVVKVRTYTLALSGIPSNPQPSKSNFTVTLTINGTDNATSTHLGAHFWNATEANPTVANSAGACVHVPEAVGALGTFTLTCSIDHAGVGAKEFFLRGHLRLAEGGTTLDWWSDEAKVTIVGVPSSPV